MQTEYPSFIYNNEKFLIIPGSRFSKNELKTRLKIMGIEDITGNNPDKKYYINLYETSLKSNQNKLKILPQLRKDTDNTIAKLCLSQRQSLPQNMISTNPSKDKYMNISHEVKPFDEKEQNVKYVHPMHTNKAEYSKNPFLSSNVMNQSQSNNSISYEYSNNLKNNKENSNANANSTFNYNNSINNSNNNSSFISQEIQFKKNNNYDNSVVSNNNISRIFNSKIQEQINRDSYNPSKNNFFSKKYAEDTSDSMNINNNYPNSKSYISQFEKPTNNNLHSMNYPNNISNKNNQYENETNNNNSKSNMNINPSFNHNTNYNNQNDSKRLTYQRDNNLDNINSNISLINNKNNDDNRKTYTNTPNPNQYLENNQYSNLNNNNNLNFIPNLPNPYRSNISSTNNNYANNNINLSNIDNQNKEIETQEKTFLGKGEENNILENTNKEKQPDEVSTFSFFSNFKNIRKIRKYPFYKNKKFILLHALILIFILCIAIGLLHLINYSWESITNFFDLLINDPGSIIESISSFFSSIFFGAINYFYITIPLIILSFVGFLYFKRYFFKRRIEEIFQEIKNDLMNNNNVNNENGIRFISEDDIYERYVKNYGISNKEFIKRYLPKLRKMREDDSMLKSFRNNVNGKEITFWEILYLNN
jgi:hypothetical protein